jgi:hypothetical protein
VIGSKTPVFHLTGKQNPFFLCAIVVPTKHKFLSCCQKRVEDGYNKQIF